VMAEPSTAHPRPLHIVAIAIRPRANRYTKDTCFIVPTQEDQSWIDMRSRATTTRQPLQERSRCSDKNSSNGTRYRKPHGSPFRQAMRRLGLDVVLQRHWPQET
jgi:hypothetical protein